MFDTSSVLRTSVKKATSDCWHGNKIRKTTYSC